MALPPRPSPEDRTERRSMWDTINLDCDEDGNFKPRQCSSEFCWCVDLQGRVLDGTHDRSKGVTCGTEAIFYNLI